MIGVWLTVFGPSLAFAAPFEVTSTGDTRWSGRQVTDFPVDPDGNTLGQDWALDQRLRTGLALHNDKVRLATEWDLFTGQLAGDPWDIPIIEDARRRDRMGVLHRQSFSARRASIQANLPGAQLEAGLVTSHWGLGMLANDGAHDPWFGETEFGDRLIRLRMSTRPAKDSPVSISSAYDRVVEDDMARWADYQWVSQGVMALLYADDSDRKIGMECVRRNQKEMIEKRNTQGGVVDFYGYLGWSVGVYL